MVERTLRLGAVALSLALFAPACAAPTVQTATWVRGADAPSVDAPAMSSRLDRRDLLRVFDETVDSLIGSPWLIRERLKMPKKTIAIVPLVNATSEHIDDQLDALNSWFETTLVKDQGLAVVSMENHPELLQQIQNEQSGAFDRATAARYGRLLGVNYIVTGKVQDVVERTDDRRRTQYFVHMQVITVETGQVVWQESTGVTKALVAL